MPQKLQDEFKEGSIVKSFNFGNKIFVNDVSEGVVLEDKFSVQIQVTSMDNNINLNNLPYWLKKLNQGFFKLTDEQGREISQFSKRRAYLTNPGTNTTKTPFELDMENFNITPTIFLKGRVDLKENGIPIWQDLKRYVRKLLDEDIKPEIYPEEYLHED